jgi:hypothetical protein
MAPQKEEPNVEIEDAPQPVARIRFGLRSFTMGVAYLWSAAWRS